MQVWKKVITVSWLLMVILCHQNVEAQQNIAQDVYAIFQQSCLNCHGEIGTFSDILTMDYTTLIENGTVIPGNPGASELYRRLLGPTENGAQMPFIADPLSQDAIDTIRRWIEVGAPNWTVQYDVDFITTDAMFNTIQNHVKSLAAFDRPFARYFTLTHLYNAAEIPEVLDAYKVALSKLINSLSWGVDVENPTAIDQQETIFYIDLRQYEWDIRKEPWTLIEQVYPYKLEFNSDTQADLQEKLEFLRQEMDCDVPFVHIDWFLATASLPPLYHDILDLPETDSELEQLLDVNVVRNLETAPGIRVWRAGLNNSRVSSNNRVLERHTSQYGAYWKSYDFAGSVGAQNILTHPLSFKQDGGEAIFNLPNGLQGYYISDASGNRIDAAPINIVSNPAATDPVVRNGLSCIGCHTEGLQTFEDVIRAVVMNSPDTLVREQSLRLYVEQSKMDDLVNQDKQRYRTALEATGGVFGGIEPVHRFYEVFQGPIKAVYAAAAVGLEIETFLEAIRNKQDLQDLGLAGLLEGGTVKRDVWTANFADIISGLRPSDDSPDDPSPDPPLPIGLVHIPDVNLRTAVEAALNKTGGTPITIEEMETLTLLVADDKGISDLRGLEYAIKLQRIELRRNSITNLSPLVKLTRLNNIKLRGNKVSDVTPLAGLLNLDWLGLEDNEITDLVPLKGLIKLRGVGLDNNPISDVSPLGKLHSLENLHALKTNITDFSTLAGAPRLRRINFSGDKFVTKLPSVAGLKGLKFLHITDCAISDISGLEELTQLETLSLQHNSISDLSPLTTLKNLTHLHLNSNVISDISHLIGLTRLEELRLDNNLISDVSPLAGLTNLKRLNLRNNAISDFSPLEELPYTISIDTRDNPGTFITSGTDKIEGPWLWVICATGGLGGANAASSGIDFLSQVSGGVVTELEIATDGAIEGNAVGNRAWTAGKIAPAEGNNINNLVNAIGLGTGDINNHVAYGSIILNSPREQKTTMLVGSDDAVKVWLNGKLVHLNAINRGSSGFQDQFSVTLKQGKNILLVAVYEAGGGWSGFFGFAPEAEYTILPHSRGFSLSTDATEVKIGEKFTVYLYTERTNDLAGWQSDIVFDPEVLEAIAVKEGDFLKKNGGSAFFQEGTIDNKQGIITRLRAARTSEGGASGDGTLLSITFSAKVAGETNVALQNFRAGSSSGRVISSVPPDMMITVTEPDLPAPVEGPGFFLTTTTTSIPTGSTFTLHLNANDITDLAGWSSDITYDPVILEAVEVSQGDFLKENDVIPFFVGGSTDNTVGKISGITTARVGGVNGTGILLSVTFKTKASGTTIVTLSNFQAGSSAGVTISSEPINITINVEGSPHVAWDVNQDGITSILDLIIVAQYLNRDTSTYPRADVNGDGTISILDLIIVAQYISESSDSAAPSIISVDNTELTPIVIQTWIIQAQIENDGSITFQKGIQNLQKLLASLIPGKTALFANYPNPFNPETWMPYQLAMPSEVVMTIHSATGKVVRTLTLGHQPAGIYKTQNRAAHWNGKNEQGELVSSGIYFYTLTAGDFTATRKMLIVK